MPKALYKDIDYSSVEKKEYSKNSLHTDKVIDKHLKILKSADNENSSLEIATEGNGAKVTGNVDVEGDLDLTGTLKVSTIQNNTVTISANTCRSLGNLSIPAGDKFYLDSGSDTYIHETVADTVEVVVGGDTVATFQEAGTEGNLVNMGTSGAGFTQHEPTYDATDTNVFFNRVGNYSTTRILKR